MKLFKNIFLVLFFVGFSVHLSSQPRTTDKIFSSESKILVISGHPNLEKSKANKAILKELEKHFGKQISIRRLDKLYPNYQINVKAEQEAIKMRISSSCNFLYTGTERLLFSRNG